MNESTTFDTYIYYTYDWARCLHKTLQSHDTTTKASPTSGHRWSTKLAADKQPATMHMCATFAKLGQGTLNSIMVKCGCYGDGVRWWSMLDGDEHYGWSGDDQIVLLRCPAEGETRWWLSSSMMIQMSRRWVGWNPLLPPWAKSNQAPHWAPDVTGGEPAQVKQLQKCKM